MYDEIEIIRKSKIQHGVSNNRIYLMKLAPKERKEVIEDLEKLAEEKGYTKIFAKVPYSANKLFESSGYTMEAFIPDFYAGKAKASFFAKYMNPKRAEISDEERETINKALDIAKSKWVSPEKFDTSKLKLKKNFNARKLELSDSIALAEIYKEVFETYPFPIHEPEYIEKTMKDNIIYFGIFDEDKLVAASSAETDPEGLNTEMTDFATLPDYRGHGFATILLDMMEKYCTEEGFIVSYTLARALSIGMNVTFAKKGYHFTGTLVHNTNISGDIESMNVWYKLLK